MNDQRPWSTLLLLVICLLIFTCTMRGESNSEPALTHRNAAQVWNTSSGLPQDTVHQVLQAHDGFLWLATEGGLVRFDGYDFAVYDKRNMPDVFTSDLVNGLLEDNAGNLWIATSDGVIERTGSGFRRYTTRDGLPSATAWAIGQDAKGRIWVGTADGLALRKAAQFEAYGKAGIFDGGLQQPMITAVDGTLWIASSSTISRVGPQGDVSTRPLPSAPVDMAVSPDRSLWIANAHSLWRLDQGGTLTTPSLPPGMGHAKLQSLAWDQAKALWVGTTAGLYTSQSPAWMRPAWRHYGKADGLPDESIAGIFPGQHGSLRIVTDAGLADENHGRFTTVFQQDGFKGREVLSLTTDGDGDIWLGSANAGVVVLRHLPFATLGSREGFPVDNVRSLLAGASDDLWIGTAAGLGHLQAGHAVPPALTTAQGLASDEILALAPGRNRDSLWIGTPDGLSHYQPGKVMTLTASDGLPDDNIRSLLLGHDSTLWVGTSHGLASLPQADPRQAKSIHTYTQVDGLGSNVIGSLLEDADGSLWIGTLGGLSHLTQGHIRNFGPRDGLTTSIVTALAINNHGLWIGTSGGGLFAFRNGKASPVATAADYAAGRLPLSIYAIVEDDSNHLWLSSAGGVYRVAASDLDALAEGKRRLQDVLVDHFNVADGLRLQDFASGGHPEAVLTPTGLLWFATQKGASVVDTHDVLRRAAPPVSIENVTVDDVALPQGADATLHISAGHARFAFHYAGISLAAPARVRYRYQLEHFDRDWVDADTRRTAYYTNIPPGHYSFRVLASLNGSEWSTTAAAIEFTIAPHYYQTWWFYLLLLVLATLIAWQLYIYRLRQVELRFNAVLAERSRIAREIHDTLAQDIVGISVQLELVSRLMTLSIDKAKTQLQETRTLVRSSLEQARSSIWDLRSSSAGDLPTRLRDAVRQITRDSGVVLRMNIGGTYRAFSRTMEDELLRIAQESVTNAVRHGQPKTIEVSLNYHAKGARLEVHDDGRGFLVSGDKAGPAGHYGIRGMHERADRAGATLEIRSSPAHGTTVIAEAPQGDGG